MGTTERILLVDDNRLQSATRRAILEGTGREVCIAVQGRQALDILDGIEDGKHDGNEDGTGGGNSFGLIVTDHLMPVMSGPIFVAELRRRGLTLPVIVLSGLPDAEAAYEGLNVFFRLKPFDPESLIHLVEELLGQGMRRSA